MTQNSGPNDTKAAAKSVRSNDANHLDFTSLPMIGLIALARTAHEGASKYGRFNYMLGFSVHDLLNHVFRHLVLFNAGDRTDNHLEHAGWGILAAIQSLALDPEMSAPHLLGPGAILTEANLDHLASNADMLKEHRDSGKFASSSDWKTVDIPEVVRLLRQRHADPSIATTAVSHETVDAKPTAHTRTYGDGSVWDKLIDAKLREFCRPCEQHVNLDNYEYSKSPREYGDRSRILSAAERDAHLCDSERR